MVTIYEIGGIGSQQFVCNDLIFGWVFKDREMMYYLEDVYKHEPVIFNEIVSRLPQSVASEVRKACCK